MFEWYKKESPILNLLGMGGGAGGNLGGGAGFSASGGTVTTSGLYTIHTFSYPNSDNFEVTSGSSEIEYLVVAGGGAGGGGGTLGGGGGGAGGLRSNHPEMPSPLKQPSLTISPGTYPVTVGQGGQADSATNRPTANPGNTSYFAGPGLSPVQGGGGGGSGGSNPPGTAYVGDPGGSGGGGGKGFPSGAGAGGSGSKITGTSDAAPGFNPQGNDGLVGNAPGSGGGGGGGALTSGGPARGDSADPNVGGKGIPLTISGSNVTYASGGNGQPSSANGGNPATLTNYGEGGNAKYGNGAGATGGTGANGIVIIRYLTP